jgi:hypothetical protein
MYQLLAGLLRIVRIDPSMPISLVSHGRISNIAINYLASNLPVL